jgi:hypothetical protein
VVAALAFSAFWLITPSVWQLGNAHSRARLTAILLRTVAAIVVWLIVYHHLWERRLDVDSLRVRLGDKRRRHLSAARSRTL